MQHGQIRKSGGETGSNCDAPQETGHIALRERRKGRSRKKQGTSHRHCAFRSPEERREGSKKEIHVIGSRTCRNPCIEIVWPALMIGLEITMIKKTKDGYKVLSEGGKNLGGPYKTKKAAEKRLRQVEFFKHRKAG